MVLDIGLPGMDGFTVLRRLRQVKNALPVVVLTAHDSPDETVAGLDGGANDYMAKPFHFRELLARVRLRLRDESTPDTNRLACGGLVLDLRTRRAAVRGRPVDLSAREFLLAETFLRHPGRSSPASSCSVTSGATTSSRGRTSSRSTSVTCGARSVRTGSRPYAEWVTDSSMWMQRQPLAACPQRKVEWSSMSGAR